MKVADAGRVAYLNFCNEAVSTIELSRQAKIELAIDQFKLHDRKMYLSMIGVRLIGYNLQFYSRSTDKQHFLLETLQ